MCRARPMYDHNKNQMAESPTQARPLWRTYLAFLAPMVLSNILQSLSGTIVSAPKDTWSRGSRSATAIVCSPRFVLTDCAPATPTP